MFYKKLYIIMAVFVALSSGILAWIIFYGDFSHHSPVRAKQVFLSSDRQDISLENKNKSYNIS